MSNREAWLEELLQSSDAEKMTDKQRRILEAAIDIFAEKGFAGASTSEIARRAGVAEGTIFRHYKTKKELLLSIAGSVMAKMVAPFILRDFRPVLDAPYERYEDFLQALVRNRLSFVEKHLPMIRILLQEIPFHEELREQFKSMIMREIFQHFERIIIHFQERGQIVSLPPARVIRLTASVMIGFLLSRFLLFAEAEWDHEEEIEICVHFIMHGLSVPAADGE